MADISKKTLRAWRRLDISHSKISARIEQALKSAGLPPLLWLRALEECERRDGEGLRPFELQRALDLEQSAVSRLLDKMAAAGAVERSECAQDRRGWRATATAQGRRMRENMAETYEQALATHFLAAISDKKARALDEILGELNEAGGLKTRHA
ncbi:MAG: MarR family winged helix-turn-helix transcriptional regulator [Rhodoblastus sp.]